MQREARRCESCATLDYVGALLVERRKRAMPVDDYVAKLADAWLMLERLHLQPQQCVQLMTQLGFDECFAATSVEEAEGRALVRLQTILAESAHRRGDS